MSHINCHKEISSRLKTELATPGLPTRCYPYIYWSISKGWLYCQHSKNFTFLFVVYKKIGFILGQISDIVYVRRLQSVLIGGKSSRQYYRLSIEYIVDKKTPNQLAKKSSSYKYLFRGNCDLLIFSNASSCLDIVSE